MADRRRYTGTRVLQVAWTLLVGLVVVVLESVLPGVVPTAATVGGGSAAWFVGLLVLGFRERRHWNRLVTASSFDRGPSGHTADFQQLIGGKSVTVTTGVTGLLAPDHTRIRTPVEGVDADFRIRIVDAELAATEGLTTGVDELDSRFAITGAEGNVATVLTESVRDALLAVGAPGEYTVTGEEVVFEVPFTHLTAAELDAAGEAVAVLANRVEGVGQQ